MKTAVKLTNSQIYEDCQHWYKLNYFQVFVPTFEKHLIRKIFPKYMDPVTSTRWKKCPCQKFFSFSKRKVLILWHHYQIICLCENVRCSTEAFYVYFYYIIILFIFVYSALVYHYCVSNILQRIKTVKK